VECVIPANMKHCDWCIFAHPSDFHLCESDPSDLYAQGHFT